MSSMFHLNVGSVFRTFIKYSQEIRFKMASPTHLVTFKVIHFGVFIIVKGVRERQSNKGIKKVVR